MSIIEYTEQMKRISTIYFKEINDDYIKESYKYFLNVKYEILKKAIDNIAIKNKYIPSINELLEECNTIKNEYKNKILEDMKNKGYFKNSQEIDKVYKWLSEGFLPKWLKNDINKYYKENLISYDNNKLLIKGV